MEAGAQGEHKIQRGYLPVTTFSCHYILDEGFRKVIGDFLVRETAQVIYIYFDLKGTPFEGTLKFYVPQNFKCSRNKKVFRTFTMERQLIFRRSLVL